MNLKNEILNKLSSNDFKDDLLIIRYIYLQVCEIFSYDVRFMYSNDDLKDEIYNKRVSLDNIEEFEFVCYTFARILVDALALYNFNAEIVRENNNHFSHVYVIVKYKNHILKLDPTKRHDNTRVKMQSSTLDFNSLDSQDVAFEKNIRKIDNAIKKSILKNEVDHDIYYNDESITRLVEVIEKGAKERKISDEELFFEKIEYIKSLINTRSDLKRYDDMDYYYSYLIKKFKLNKPNKIYIKPAVFFKNDDKKMKEIINITLIEYKNLSPIFLVMIKENENYNIKEVDKQEITELLRIYSSPIVQYYFEQKAKKMSNSKII